MSKKMKLNIQGMHCSACEVLIERKWKKVKGIEQVNVNHATGEAEVLCSCEPKLEELNEAIREQGYAAAWERGSHEGRSVGSSLGRERFQTGAVALIVLALYLILKQLDLVPQFGVGQGMGYGVVFLMGLVASVSSCLAVTGGLLLASVARYHERHPELTSVQKFKPTLYFNIGRVVGYAALGGLVGAVGSAFTFSTKVTGIITIAASLAMIVLGFKLLNLFPSAQRFMPRMPKFLGHRVHDMSESRSRFAPFSLGAATFFLPCGFTQALQLYVLAQGKPLEGALIMFLFSLGTLPALLSLSALSSFIQGRLKSYFFKFAGVVVVMIGLFNISNGFTLAGTSLKLPTFSKSTTSKSMQNSNVKLVNGVQIADMRVQGLQYYPSQFVVKKGMPVEWRIDGSGAAGCAQVITAPKLKLNAYLPAQGVKTVKFTPQEAGEIKFSCSMGMTTPGAKFIVIEDNASAPAIEINTGNKNGTTACDPLIANCI